MQHIKLFLLLMMLLLPLAAEAEEYADGPCVMWLHPNSSGPEYGPGAHYSRDETAAKIAAMEKDSAVHLPELFEVAARGLCYLSTRQVPVGPGVIGGNIAAEAILRQPDCAAAVGYWQRLNQEQRKRLPDGGEWLQSCGK